MQEPLPATWVLSINNDEWTISSFDELRKLLEQVQHLDTAEVHLYGAEGPGIGMLMNQRRALLLFFREEGDPGFTSRNPMYQGQSEHVMEFYLSNGQCDEYPLQWTYGLAEALDAIEYVYLYHQKPTRIAWHDDS